MMQQSENPTFETVTDALNWLYKQGYLHDFNLDVQGLQARTSEQVLSPDDFKIDYFFRFEGNTDPGDEDVVYGIHSSQGVKGVLMNAFGVYADGISAEMIKKLSTHP